PDHGDRCRCDGHPPPPAAARPTVRRRGRPGSRADAHRGREMNARVRWAATAAGLAVTLVGGVLVSALGRSATFDPVAVLGTPTPRDTLPLLNGGTVRLDDLQGKAVIVNFWNSWCQPCLQEAPSLDRFYAQNAGDQSWVMI